MPAELHRDEASERVRALYEAHAATLLRHAKRRNPQLAEDVVAETFAVAVRRADEIPAGRELAWLYVVSDFVLKNMVRSQRRAGRVTDALSVVSPRSVPPVEPPVVGAALSTLPDRERQMLTMTAFEGLSANEAAERIGIPYGSARNALVAGRRRLALSLAAVGVALLVLLALRPMLAADPGDGSAPAQLEASIADAGAIHEVALVRRAGGRRDPSAAARYERWSDPAGDRQRVVLPGGGLVTTRGGEPLEAAAARTAQGAAPISPSAQEDLAALDAASPAVIAALVADPAARRTSTRGLRTGGRTTTTIRGRVVGAGKIEHSVAVTIADDRPEVLSVRAQRLERGARVGPLSIVEFVEWHPVPKGPGADAALTDGGERPSSAGTPKPEVPTAPAAAAPDRAETTGGIALEARRMAALAARTVRRAAATPTRRERSAMQRASAPILYVHQSVQVCATGPSSCRSDGFFDLWIELGGQARSRAVQRRAVGDPVRSEQWSAGDEWSFWLTGRNGHSHGGLHRDEGPSGHEVAGAWKGSWMRRLAPQLKRLLADPAALVALPPGPEIDGHATVVATTSLPGRPGVGPPLSVDLRIDPVARIPREIHVHRSGLYGEETYTMRIDAFTHHPAGAKAHLLTGRFPKGMPVVDYRCGGDPCGRR